MFRKSPCVSSYSDYTLYVPTLHVSMTPPASSRLAPPATLVLPLACMVHTAVITTGAISAGLVSYADKLKGLPFQVLSRLHEKHLNYNFERLAQIRI